MDTLARAWLPTRRSNIATASTTAPRASCWARCTRGRRRRAALEDRTTRKTYLGVVAASCAGPSRSTTRRDERQLPRARRRRGRQGRVDAVRGRGVPLPASRAEVALTPHTGRQHQLRAHLPPRARPRRRRDYDNGPTAAAARMMLHAWKLRVPLPEGRRLVARSRDPFPIRGGRLRPRVDPGLGRARIV